MQVPPGEDCMCMCAQLCPSLGDPMDCSPRLLCPWAFPGKKTEVLPCPPPGDFFSQPRDRTRVSCVSCNGRWILYHLTRRGRLFWYSQSQRVHFVPTGTEICALLSLIPLSGLLQGVRLPFLSVVWVFSCPFTPRGKKIQMPLVPLCC